MDINPAHTKMDICPALLRFRFLRTTHAQTNHAVTSAVNRIHAQMEARALSYATTPKTSSTAHARQEISVNSVRSEGQHRAGSLEEVSVGYSQAYIFCLIQRPALCTKSFAILILQMGLFGPLWSRSVLLIRTSSPTKHFIKTILSIEKPLPGIGSVCRGPG